MLSSLIPHPSSLRWASRRVEGARRLRDELRKRVGIASSALKTATNVERREIVGA